MSRPQTVLIVDDEEPLRKQLRWGLADDFHVLEAHDRDTALRAVKQHEVDAVLLDLRFPPKLDDISGGREILDAIRTIRASLPVIIMTGDHDRGTAVEMVARGAFDLFRKPVDLDELKVIVRRALRLRALERQVRELSSRLDGSFGLDSLVGRSPAMQKVARRVRRIADTQATVLITGESGTGKELIARALHQLSSRREAPFVALNCAALPADLVDDELFGHEQGAFTGAAQRRIGKFEYASGGTLFLDEVGDLPEPVQVKLLRVLQESEVQRLGSNETISIDVRLLAATHQNLEQRCREGAFREDLFYRLNVLQLPVPPLRDRAGDVPLLADHFLKKHATPRSPHAFSAAALKALSRFDWPGNVRQLENVVNALSVTCEGAAVEADDLPAEIRGQASPVAVAPSAGAFDLAATERELIRQALERTSGNRTRAAKLLGISRHVLLTKLKKHGLS